MLHISCMKMANVTIILVNIIVIQIEARIDSMQILIWIFFSFMKLSNLNIIGSWGNG